MEIRRVRMAGGDTYPMLIGGDGIPLPYPSLFVLVHHRNSSDSSNTCYKAFEHIRYLLEILEVLEVSLVDRCVRGNSLTEQEVDSLGYWARKNVKSLRAAVDRRSSKPLTSPTTIPIRKKLETARGTIALNENDDVSPTTAYNRLSTFAEYIGWLEHYLFPSRKFQTKTLLKRLRPSKNLHEQQNPSLDSYRSLSREQVMTVLAAVRPSDPQNPWQSESLKFRNELIFRMLEALGCRRGELLRIRLNDIKKRPEDGRRYVVIRTSAFSDDTRLNKPEAKTLGRSVPLDMKLGQLLDQYVVSHRSTVRGAEHIPFLFVTHNRGAKSQALSSGALNKLCREISVVVGFRVHPHAFRHEWNDRFSSYADKRIAAGKTTEAKSESDRQLLMGWAPESKMAGHYSRRHEEKRAFEVGLALQNPDRLSSELDLEIKNNDDN